MLSFSAEVLKAIGLKISCLPNKLSPPTLSFKVIGSPLLFWENDPLANKFYGSTLCSPVKPISSGGTKPPASPSFFLFFFICSLLCFFTPSIVFLCFISFFHCSFSFLFSRHTISFWSFFRSALMFEFWLWFLSTISLKDVSLFSISNFLWDSSVFLFFVTGVSLSTFWNWVHSVETFIFGQSHPPFSSFWLFLGLETSLFSSLLCNFWL